jgi:hypothetical protein
MTRSASASRVLSGDYTKGEYVRYGNRLMHTNTVEGYYSIYHAWKVMLQLKGFSNVPIGWHFNVGCRAGAGLLLPHGPRAPPFRPPIEARKHP